jgi:hypothetical protein
MLLLLMTSKARASWVDQKKEKERRSGVDWGLICVVH